MTINPCWSSVFRRSCVICSFRRPMPNRSRSESFFIVRKPPCSRTSRFRRTASSIQSIVIEIAPCLLVCVEQLFHRHPTEVVRLAEEFIHFGRHLLEFHPVVLPPGGGVE